MQKLESPKNKKLLFRIPPKQKYKNGEINAWEAEYNLLNLSKQLLIK